MSAQILPPNDGAMQDSGRLSLPPGFAGVIAQYLYDSAPRQHREPAIVGTLGLLAGVNGRAYTVSSPKMGLNLYAMLIMETAMGKESMFRISYLHSKACAEYARAPGSYIDNVAIAHSFLETGSAASMAGMRRRMQERGAAFVNTLTELGQNIKEMATATSESPAFQLKRLFLELFEKSGPDQMLGGIHYSKSENNMDSIPGPAVSIIGDTTPDTFYSAMNTTLASDGFLSRWCIVECPTHVRPPWNKNIPEPSAELLLALRWMIHAAAEAVRTNIRTHLECDTEAQALLDAFDQEFDSSINGTRDATVRAAWARSMAKAYRIAGNLAVADYYGFAAWAYFNKDVAPAQPPLMIRQEHMEWAVALERRNAKLLTTRIKTGDIGDGDDSRRDKLLTLLSEYLDQQLPERWQRFSGLRTNGIVPYEWLQMRTQKLAGFRNEKQRATSALKQIIQSLIDAGTLMEVEKKTLVEGFDFHGKCYRILSLPGYEPSLSSAWMFTKTK